MSLNVKDAGVWKDAVPSVKDAGVWKACTEMWAKIAGAWTLVYSALATYNTPAGNSSFTATNYQLISSRPVVYTWSKSGTGSSASPASPATTDTLTLSLTPSTSPRFANFSISANDNGTITVFDIELFHGGTA